MAAAPAAVRPSREIVGNAMSTMFERRAWRKDLMDALREAENVLRTRSPLGKILSSMSRGTGAYIVGKNGKRRDFDKMAPKDFVNGCVVVYGQAWYVADLAKNIPGEDAPKILRVAELADKGDRVALMICRRFLLDGGWKGEQDGMCDWTSRVRKELALRDEHPSRGSDLDILHGVAILPMTGENAVFQEQYMDRDGNMMGTGICAVPLDILNGNTAWLVMTRIFDEKETMRKLEETRLEDEEMSSPIPGMS